MKKSQIKVFEELLATEDFQGKKQLKHLLWLNTSKPKYEVGQYVTVTNYSHRVYGNPVVGFKAKIKKISSFSHTEEWFYEMEMDVTCGDKHGVFEEYAYESEIKRGAKNNLNVLKNRKGDADDAISVSL